MYDNAVQVNMRSLMAPMSRSLPPTKKLYGVAGMVDGDMMAFTPFTDADKNGNGATVQPTYKNRGTASLLLLAAAYYDPKLSNTLSKLGLGDMTSDENADTTTGNGQLGQQVQTNNRKPLPGQAGKIAED